MANARLLTWSEQLATGLADVDHQHQRLIGIINALGDMHAQGASAGELIQVLGELRDYTRYHFQHEADLMQSLPVNQANKAAHLKDHQGFGTSWFEPGKWLPQILTMLSPTCSHFLSNGWCITSPAWTSTWPGKFLRCVTAAPQGNPIRRRIRCTTH